MVGFENVIYSRLSFIINYLFLINHSNLSLTAQLYPRISARLD